MPLIWVKRKDGEWTSLITDFTANTVMVNGYVKTMNVLFYDNIFLDGKPCGVEMDRDIHAAQNMVWFYENKVGVGRTNFKRVEIKALVSEALASGIKLEFVKHEADMALACQ